MAQSSESAGCVRPAVVADFPQLMDRLHASFADGWPGHARFEDIYPDIIAPTAACMNEFVVVEHGGEIAAGLQVVPRPLVVAGEVCLNTGGLGQVFCYPSFRKHGYMSALLTACIARMNADRCVLSMLGGDRQRYSRYGWECAGAERVLQLSSRLLPPLPAGQDAGRAPRHWRGDPGDTARMAAAYRRLPYRCERPDDAMFAKVLARPGSVIWLEDTGDALAYAVLRGNHIAEYAGDPACFLRLLHYLLTRMQLQVTVPPPDAAGELDRLLVRTAGHWAVDGSYMIRINSLLGTLQAYLPVLQRRLRGWQGEFSFEITDGGEAATLCGGSAGASVREGRGGATVVPLSRCEIAQLLFASFPPASLGTLADHEVVRRLCPLPFYWHALGHV